MFKVRNALLSLDTLLVRWCCLASLSVDFKMPFWLNQLNTKFLNIWLHMVSFFEVLFVKEVYIRCIQFSPNIEKPLCNFLKIFIYEQYLVVSYHLILRRHFDWIKWKVKRETLKNITHSFEVIISAFYSRNFVLILQLLQKYCWLSSK
jgi:hypothetical protein